MRGGGYNRGGGGRGRGGFRGGAGGGAYPQYPSDTLNIRVTDVRHQVTEEMLRQVFSSVGVVPRQVTILPSNNPTEANVVVQLNDQFAAETVMTKLNNRYIYNESNKMTIHYAQSNMGGGGGVLGAPQAGYNAAVQPPPNMFGYNPMQNMGMPMANMYQTQNLFDPMGGRGGRGMGFRGRGGRGMGYPNMAPMGFGGNDMNMNQMQGRINQNTPTVYLSVTLVPETSSLQSIFVLMEAFGTVTSIRRTQRKKEILTVKMASIEDADAVVRHLRRVPYAGGTVSAKRFPTYVDKHPCTDDGDANDPATEQYDFTASRHRSPSQRAQCDASRVLKITGCGGCADSDISSYLSGKGFTVESISHDDDANFIVTMPDIESAVKALIECHGSVCGEEKSNILFVPDPAAEAAAAAAAAAASSPANGDAQKVEE